MKDSDRIGLELDGAKREYNDLVTTIHELPADKQPSSEQTAKLTELRDKVTALETRRSAALEVEQRAADKADGEFDEAGQRIDGEARERRELRSRSKLSRYVGAAIAGRTIDGAEAEYSEAEQCGGNVPLDLFASERRAEARRGEQRAVTPGVGANEAQTNLAPIVPAIFDRSAAAWLGIEMPMVATGDAGYPVLSTSLTGGPKAKSDPAAEGAGAFSVTMAQPRRVTGSFRFTREDAARLVGMEDALRANISSVLADQVDDQAINGSGSGDGTINGLLSILTDPSVPDAGAESFARYVRAAAEHVDGLFAVDLMGVRMLVGVQTYGNMAGMFRANQDSMTAEGWMMTRTGGVRTSRRIAAPANDVQQAIVRRANPAGDRVAVMPVWNGLELIRDPYTAASKGEVVVTGLMLVGDVVVLRGGAFVQDSFRLA